MIAHTNNEHSNKSTNRALTVYISRKMNRNKDLFASLINNNTKYIRPNQKALYSQIEKKPITLVQWNHQFPSYLYKRNVNQMCILHHICVKLRTTQFIKRHQYVQNAPIAF